MAPQSPQTAPVVMRTDQGNPQMFSVTKSLQPSLPINKIGEKLPGPFRKTTDLQVEEGPGYIYLPKPTDRPKQGPNGADPGGDGS